MGLLLNQWLWSPALPFLNYQASLKKTAILGIGHTLTLLALLVALIWWGHALTSKHRAWRSMLVANWLLTWGWGIVTLAVALFAGQTLGFSDLVTVAFPLAQNATPLVGGLLVAPLAVHLVTYLSGEGRRRLRFALLMGLGVATLFNRDPWGLGQGTTALAVLILVALGASLPPRPVTRQRRLAGLIGLLFVVAIGLTALMPAISLTVHRDWSTANRLNSPTNVLLVLIALGVVRLLDGETGSHRSAVGPLVNGLLPLALVGTMPLSQNWWLMILQGQTGRVTRLIGSAILLAIGVTLLALLLTWLTDRLFRLPSIATRVTRWGQSLPVTGSQAMRRLGHLLVAKRWQWGPWVYFFGLSLASFLLMGLNWQLAPNVDASYNAVLYTLGNCQGMLLATTLLLWTLWKLLQIWTKRSWFSFALVTGGLVVWVVANRMKISARNEPILPAEVRNYQSYGDLLRMMSPWILLLAVILWALVLFAGWRQDQRLPRPHLGSWPARIGWLLVTIVLFSSAHWWNHPASVPGRVMTMLADSPDFANQAVGAQLNGPVIQFMNNLDVAVMERPADYNAKTMCQVATRYQKLAREINRKRNNNLADQTLVFNLSESFADPRRVPGVKVAPNPMPYIDQVKQARTSGLMVSSGYGGGTANMEYMALTGLPVANFMPTLSTPYTQLVPMQKHPWAISKLFQRATAIHPYVGTFYSRATTYQQFGFQRFFYLGSKYAIKHQHRIDRSPYLDDRTAYANLLDQLRAGKRGQFINLVTMQNHFPYDRNYYNHTDRYRIKVAKDTPVASLADYVMGVHYTDQAVKQLLSELDRMDQPVTMVFYGDHLPGIYTNEMAKDGLKLHETDYFIYSNRAAIRQGAKRQITKNRVVGPNDFIALAAEQTNSKVTPYLAFLTQAYHDLPVVAMPVTGSSQDSHQVHPSLITRNGKLTDFSHLTVKQRQLWHDYQLIQYDLTTGNQYLVRDGMLGGTR